MLVASPASARGIAIAEKDGLDQTYYILIQVSTETFQIIQSFNKSSVLIRANLKSKSKYKWYKFVENLELKATIPSN